ncbi:MAG: hypothetical protein E6Q88_10965 [Lysobacteraceae bacterium]|nr:MAG: hypothetical protein E6Q88_10965 [Xanthomonadaceae bacterium]
MSKVIQFLEAMGSNAAMARMSIADYQAAVAALELDEQQRESLLQRDHVALGRTLGARDTLLCLICLPHDDEEKQSPPDQDDREEETPPPPQ